jgi:hypothetical protein
MNFLPSKRMGGAVVGEQMAFGRDARQDVGIGPRHAADDEERALDAVRLQRVEHGGRVVVRAVVEGERDVWLSRRPEWKMFLVWK